MAASLRPLSTGELLDQTFNLYRQNFLLFFGIAAVPQLVLFLVIVAAGVVLGLVAGRTGGVRVLPEIAVVPGFAYLAGSMIATAVTQAATTFAVSALYLEQPVSLGRSFSLAKGRILAVIGVTILFGISVGIGFMLLVIPGILVLMWYSLAVPATVVEQIGVSRAFNRSSSLSKGSGWRILGVYILLLILTIVLDIGIEYLVAFALRPLKGIPAVHGFLSGGTSYLVGALVAPILTIALTLLYYDQRVRKEGFDLEHMMSVLQAASAPGSATTAGAAV
ncbi:MAG TPA: hypothetical protein VM912_00305 [Terriglobales bacterium]|nr:hypothetical protein [Terriglobales bacterium]